jgi:hypothetical protein
MPKWATDPFHRFFDFVDEAHRVLMLSMRGIASLRAAGLGAEALLQLDLAKDARQRTPADEERLAEAKELASLAESEVDKGFPLLHAHAVVAVWGALEALVDDVLVVWLCKRPQLLTTAALASVRVPLARFLSLDEEQRMLLLLEELKRDLRSGFTPGVAGFEGLLASVGLSGPLDEEVKRTLIEMRAVRNVFVHRRAVCDLRFCQTCPWLSLQVGETVETTHSDYHRYQHAAHEYVMCLIKRAAGYFGVQPCDFESSTPDSCEASATEDRQSP